MEIRTTEESHLPALDVLFRDRFDHGISLEEWRWKYGRIPGTARSALALDEAGTVLAHAGALRLPARWSGGEGGIWQLVDFAGRTGGRGLRAALVELGRSLLADLPEPGDAPWIFGFPSERHFRLGQRVFGYGPLATWREWVGAIPSILPSTAPCEVEVSDSCGDWAEAVWRRCEVLGVRRSAAFLNWRYHARPDRYYRFYRLHGEAGDALAVFAFAGTEAAAVELWLPRPWRLRDALAPIAADLRASGLERWRFWPQPACLERGAGEWEALGLAAGAEVFCGYRGRLGAPDPLPESARFYYALGDHDIA